MASSAAIWGIEIGQCAVKAVKLRASDEGAEVSAFDVVEHDKVLSAPDANRDELIAGSLKKFVERNSVQGDRFVIGVPGQQTFARFCKLPPADPRRLGALVRYEAEQQIPFDINDVVWDFQKFEDENSPEIEVGIFAMRKDLIQKHLDYFNAVKIRPYVVQAAPSALYNFARYEYDASLKDGALVVIDVGTQNTDLIIIEPNRAWSRNIPLGGSAFTEALVRAFKLPFPKAEDMKRKAASSKYARQIFQAMRPVFAELVQEIQRSIGYYSSSHRDSELKQVLAVGNAFRLPGLQKYVENNLTIPGGVARLDSFKRIKLASDVDATKFNEHLLNLGTTCGLALQGLGLSKITADLLPPELARLAVWKRKQWWFAGAAACAAVAAGVPFLKNSMDRAALAAGSNDPRLGEINRIVADAQKHLADFNAARKDTSAKEQEIAKFNDLLSKKRIVPGIIAIIHQALPQPEAELAAAQSGEALKSLIAANPAKFQRNKRKQFIIESLSLDFEPDVDNAQLVRAGGFQQQPTEGGPAAGGNPGFVARMQTRIPFGATQSEVLDLITREFYERLRTLAQQPGLDFHIPLKDPPDVSKAWMNRQLQVQRASGSTGGGGGGYFGAQQGGTPAPQDASGKDPVTGEPNTSDWMVELAVKFKLGDAPPPSPTETAAAEQKPPGNK